MASAPITSREIDGETVRDFILGAPKITADGDCSHEIKTLTPWKKNYDQSRQLVKKQTLLCQQCQASQSYGFPNSHVWMSELDFKES